MTNLTNQLNNQDYKEKYLSQQKSLKLLILAFIKKCPKKILIEVLKEQKIIKRDWCAKGEKYEKT